MSGEAAVGLHPETIASDSGVLRWVCTEQFPAIGRLVDAPGALGRLLASGVIEQALVERGAVWTWLGPGRDWASVGGEVRDALQDALADPAGWVVEPTADEVLGLVARDVIGRTLGGYIASHGGQIELVRAAGDQVEVQLDGTCAHCPAAGMTLHGRIEREIRERVGDQVVVHATGDCDERPGTPGWWPKLLRRPAP